MSRKVKQDLPNILVVDDDKNHLNTLKGLLSKLDIVVHLADSGSKALSLLLRHDFLLILMDIKMPVMDGLETAKLIRDNEKSLHIPIIFMTAFDKDELQVNEGYKLGAIDYLFKPINQTILISKIDIFLRFLNKEKENLIKEKEAEKEKQEIAKKLVHQLEEKNKELQSSQLAALNMMEDANEARNNIEKSEMLVKMQAKDLEQFAYTATHDIKTPINNIESYLTFLKNDKTIRSEKSLMAIEWIDKSVEHCKKLINNLVTVVKVKEESNFDITENDLNEILETVFSSLQSEIKESKASIKTDFSALDSIVYSAPHLESLILNLVSNAIKYKSPDKALRIKISTSKQKEYTTFSVADNGIGINVKRDKEKVFGLFKRANIDVEGTGMGLYIVNETLKKFGGKIALESEEGEGATFTVYFKNNIEQ